MEAVQKMDCRGNLIWETVYSLVFMKIVGTNSFGGRLKLDIARTTNSGGRLSIGIVGTIDSGEGPLIEIVRVIDHGDCL